ncbi:MAG: class I SAM-dependent methyltransferase [Salibacteraceae bacterium]
MHWVRSKTRHGVHSPFVYGLIDECIYATTPRVPKFILDYFDALKGDRTLIEGHDLGKNAQTQKSVGHYARKSSMHNFQVQLLFRLIDYLKPNQVLELGSNLGKSISAMAAAYESAYFIGVEGNNALAVKANENLQALNLTSRSKVISSSFDAYFDANQQRFDFIFLDGDHHEQPTLRYFLKMKKVLNEGGVMVFHDIHYSSGMKRAWSEIKKDQDVSVTLDLFFFGLVWMGKPQAKEDFDIRFPRLLNLFFLA